MKSSPKAPHFRKKGGAFVLAILDPFQTAAGRYNFNKDSSHLLLLALAQQGHQIYYADPSSLLLGEKGLKIRTSRVTVLSDAPYFSFAEAELIPAKQFDLILMRKDPPVDLTYLFATQALSTVAKQVPVINAPQALRDWNEKLVIFNFPRWIPRSLVTLNRRELDQFIQSEGGTALAKPLDHFAGKGVIKLTSRDPDYPNVLDRLTADGTRPILIQTFLNAITRGEKRIFMIEGKPLGALMKIPPEGGYITNPDQGGRLAPTELSTPEKKLCQELGPFLKKAGIFFAGVDLIGGKLTEINITSPGLLWEWNEVDRCRHEVAIVEKLEQKIQAAI